MKYILLLFLLSGCAHKTLVKNCEDVGESDYSVCETLNPITGR